MSEQEIYEANKVIAKFMGVEIVKRNNEDAVYMFKDAAFPEYFRCTQYSQYDLKWEMLMDVVKKICQTKYTDGDNAYFRTFGMINIETGMFMSRINRCQVFEAENLKKAVWLSVVDWCRTA